ncbi:MAG: polyphenol oxidase family protein [Patescibacteria group bacterium]
MDFLLATSTVQDGNMSPDWGPEAGVRENRRKFLTKHGFAPEQCVYMDLQHGSESAVVGEKEKGTILKVDALMTMAPGVALFLMTADCFPVAYHDPVKNAVALAHLGWKSTDKNLAAQVVERMTQEFHSDPGDILVFIGPGIDKDSYLVERPGQKDDPKWRPFLDEAMGSTKIDLVGYNENALIDAGVPREHITVSPENTVSSPEYFSHRRSGKTGESEGRFATVAALTR